MVKVIELHDLESAIPLYGYEFPHVQASINEMLQLGDDESAWERMVHNYECYNKHLFAIKAFQSKLLHGTSYVGYNRMISISQWS